MANPKNANAEEEFRRAAAQLKALQEQVEHENYLEELKPKPPEDDLSSMTWFTSQPWAMPKFTMPPMPALKWGAIENTPAVDLSKLESLKSAKPRKVEEKMPDMMEVITAWRAWGLDDGKLCAIGQDDEWPAKQALIGRSRN